MNDFFTKPEIVEQPEFLQAPGCPQEDYSNLQRGDTVFLADGRQVTIVRRMDREGWRYMVQELAPEDFDIVEYLNR